MRSQRDGLTGLIGTAVIAIAGVAFGLATYLQNDELQERERLARRESEQRAAERDAARRTVAFLSEKIGQPLGLTDDALKTRIVSDLVRRGGEENYALQADRLYHAVDAQRARADAAEAAARELQKRLAGQGPRMEAKLDEVQKSLDRKAAEVLSERKKSHEMLAELEGRLADLQGQLAGAKRDVVAIRQDKEREVGEAQNKIRELGATIKGLKAQQALIAGDPGAAKAQQTGSVLGVDGAAKLVTLDVGREKGARVGMNFRLYRPDVGGRPGTEVALVEIARLEEKSSKARIVQNDVRVPILAGDLAVNPLIGGSGGESVAIAGRIDLDGDGKDDSERLKRIVVEQGGTVDCHLDVAGRMIGRLTPKIRFLVADEVGLGAPVKGNKAEYLTKLGELRREAADFGIPIVSGRKFVEEMGYRLDLRAAR
ncbi:MAG TPA: hypothetical protein VNC50_17740 [Planctomycetia bacterium]|nr:hypothetical protein [Planctomycetia bacterium]